ncbi:MAG: squalene--hopene cyclase [Planctomycetia bacterium]|nr:squalene--hopene cyclase [Planctomycetia bacterium]
MFRSLSLTAALVAVSSLVLAASKDEPAYNPGPNKADEPAAKSFSLEQAGKFLDHVGSKWTSDRKCGTCHTNVPMMWAKPALKSVSAEEKNVRKFFEERVANWDRGQKGDAPRWDTEVIVTGVTLAIHDAKTTGKLHPMSETALNRMWKLQKPHGAWNWLKCNWPPQEHDDEFGAVFAAVGLSLAPGGYAKSDTAKAGLEKLRNYLTKTPMPSLHHKAWLLWASARLDGLMTAEEQQKTVQALRALQKPDGGWSLPSLGAWEGYDKRENDTKAASDGYGTGLVVFVLREAGVSKDDPALVKAVQWLKTNQRVSGRWWTRSLNTDRAHFIANAGTAYAVMALDACR